MRAANLAALHYANGQHSYYEEIRGLRNKKTPWYDVYGSQMLASDIGKFKHVARAQDNRGVEFGKPITFENTGKQDSIC